MKKNKQTKQKKEKGSKKQDKPEWEQLFDEFRNVIRSHLSPEKVS